VITGDYDLIVVTGTCLLALPDKNWSQRKEDPMTPIPKLAMVTAVPTAVAMAGAAPGRGRLPLCSRCSLV